jgi:hypothetical protein
MFWPKVHAVSKRLQRAASLATIASTRKQPGGGVLAAAEDDPESREALRSANYALRSGSFQAANQSGNMTADEGDRPFIERVEHLLVLRSASSSASLRDGESPRRRRHVGLQVNVSDHVSEVSVDDAPASDDEPAPSTSLPASLPTPAPSTAKSKTTLSGGKMSRGISCASCASAPARPPDRCESQDTGQASSTEEVERKQTRDWEQHELVATPACADPPGAAKLPGSTVREHAPSEPPAGSVPISKISKLLPYV